VLADGRDAVDRARLHLGGSGIRTLQSSFGDDLRTTKKVRKS